MWPFSHFQRKADAEYTLPRLGIFIDGFVFFSHVSVAALLSEDWNLCCDVFWRSDCTGAVEISCCPLGDGINGNGGGADISSGIASP